MIFITLINKIFMIGVLGSHCIKYFDQVGNSILIFRSRTVVAAVEIFFLTFPMFFAKVIRNS